MPDPYSPSTILVFGRTGQIATELGRLSSTGRAVTCLGRPEGDITDPVAIEAAMERARPGVVVNAAAYTAVDKAETDVDAAMVLNGEGPGYLARACAGRNLPLIHISTDYVFDGAKSGPYVEDDPVAPLGAYGRSKLAGEEAVRAVLDRHVILRTAWIYSPFGHNFMKTMIRLGRERDRLRVVDDQAGSPTAARSVAEAIITIAGNLVSDPGRGYGTFHLVDEGATTWYGFAQGIFALLAERGHRVPIVEPIPTSLYPTPARRPANSVLDCRKLLEVHGIMPRRWEARLQACLDEYLAIEPAPAPR